MGVRISLARQGRKKSAHYRIRVMDTRRDVRSGNFIEDLGHHDPLSPMETGTSIDLESTLAWIKKGAQPSEKVRHILKALQPKPQAAAKSAAKKKTEAKAAPKKETVKAEAKPKAAPKKEAAAKAETKDDAAK